MAKTQTIQEKKLVNLTSPKFKKKNWSSSVTVLKMKGKVAGWDEGHREKIYPTQDNFQVHKELLQFNHRKINTQLKKLKTWTKYFNRQPQ